MKLFEAYELMRSSAGTSDIEPRRLALAQTIVYEEIQRQSKYLKKDLPCEDIVQDVFLTLNRRGTPLATADDSAARGYIGRALNNAKLSSLRKATTRQKYVSLGGDEESVEKEQQQWSVHASSMAETHHGEVLKLQEELGDSILFGDAKTLEELHQRARDFLKNTAIVQAIKRAPARQRATQHIVEMQKLVDEETTFDELIDAQVEAESDENERKKARAAIHKSHSRTRKKLLEWIETAENDLIVESSEEAKQLSNFDIKLLRATVSLLRSRKESVK